MRRITRRQRLLLITLGSSVVFLTIAALAAFRWAQRETVYRPGEAIDGVTSELARSVPADHPKVVFADATREAGIAFRHFSGSRSSQLPEDMGSGAAWGDYDNDGWLDLVIANEVGALTMPEADRHASPARLALFHNEGDGRFTDVTAKARIEFRGWGMGVAWGDYDNDRHIDLVVTAYGKNRLLRNNGDGSFADVSVAAGIDGPTGFWTGASWGDYDRDGLLDLYVTGYVRYARPEAAPLAGAYDIENPASINPSSFPAERNLLYHNDGDGTFTERAVSAGVVDARGRGLSAAWVDFDEDGWPDLYVANDLSDNALFRNLGDGSFVDLSRAARVSDYRGSMGIAIGDWDGDGDQDMFLTHWIAQENALYTNRLAPPIERATRPTSAPLTFIDEADRRGLGQSSLDFVGWGTSFFDYDNDGRLDLFAANGSTLQQPSDSTRLVPMRNQLFWNRGPDQGFVDVSGVSGPPFREEHVGRGAAFGDYDNDGDVDIFVVNHGGAGLLLRNDGGNRNHWLQVELRGTRSNRQGIGAAVRLVVGRTVHMRQIGAQSSYLSQNGLIETFGLGPATRADTLEVRWPSGARDMRTGLASHQRIVVTEGEDRVDDRERIRSFWTVYREATARRVGGQPRDASDGYARALALDPDHEDALYYAGAVRLELGDFDGAARAWRHLLEVNPSSARTHSRLGELHLCLDPGAPLALDSAQHHLGRAHELNREENGPMLRLGEVALLRGDLKAARRWFATVLATNATSAPARFYTGYVAWKENDAARAREEFRRSISGGPGPPPAGLLGEGDRKSGTGPPIAEPQCRQIRSVAEASAALERDMTSRYQALDSLLRVARRRAR